MKSLFGIATILSGLLFFAESCQRCSNCKRNDLEARCVKPGDTLVFNQDLPRIPRIQRNYDGGDSIYYRASTGFNNSVQEFTDSGYTCSVYETGNISIGKSCNGPGEQDDRYYISAETYEYWGYTCK